MMYWIRATRYSAAFAERDNVQDCACMCRLPLASLAGSSLPLRAYANDGLAEHSDQTGCTAHV